MKTLLITLVSFVWITASLAGLIIINHPDGAFLYLSLSLLGNTPFNNFLVPGLILILIVGGVNLVALFYNFLSLENRYEWSIAAGVVISGYIVVQVVMLQAYSWMQIVYLGTGITIISVAAYLRNEWRSNSHETQIF
ncbi:MAG: hypothetical protein JWP81_3374 [Ferruginibacter sp.]|nr:hypothetical protein [Ferruginibacter sp.]